ncbi:helix-turn-helix domain-containing protein [Adonisia turfae]|uniref:helix-turn-helix domain-containing protein n=1 Tax=Adonisia turfae TaxID=2950184 RepID=UPI003D6F3FD7
MPPEPVSIDDFREASPLTKSKLSREEIKRLHESGKSLRQIAKMAGISHQGVAYHLD